MPLGRFYVLAALASGIAGQAQQPFGEPKASQDQRSQDDYAAWKARNTRQAAPIAPRSIDPAPSDPKISSSSAHVGKHLLGETFTAWIAAMSGRPSDSPEIDLAAFCKNQKRMDFRAKADCKRLSEIQSAGAGEFVTYEGTRMYYWIFADQRLSEIHVAPNLFAQREIDRQLNFAEEVSFLEQTYGPPSENTTRSYNNAYGAKWTRAEISWNLDDGSTILALEDPAFAQQGKLLRIEFLSRSDPARRPPPPKPNPYQQ